MEERIGEFIRDISYAIGIISILGFLFCVAKAFGADDQTATFFWCYGVACFILSFAGSFLIYGFAYIVEASFKYLERCEQEEYLAEHESNEE